MLLARDPNLDRHVAVKVPLPDVMLSPEMRARFLREGRAAAALRHTNIVPVFEAAEIGPICYLVAEYCEGPTLAAWFAGQRKPLAVNIAAAIARDLARGIHHAHQKGIVHCDLKPGNVLLEKSAADGLAFCPRITDFGMARLVEPDGDQTRTGSVLGTPAYMSPEQAAGNRKAIGPATDVFALGVILFELLSGRRPFQRDTPLATLNAIQHESATISGDGVVSLPPGFDPIVQRCLSKAPDERYATAADLADDLERCLTRETISTHINRSTSDRPAESRIRRPLIAAIVGVVGFVAMLPFIFSSDPESDSASSAKSAANQSKTAEAKSVVRKSVPLEKKSSDQRGPKNETVAERYARNRRVAEWIVRNRGRVVIKIGRRGGTIRELSHFPKQNFTIQQFDVVQVRPLDAAMMNDILALRECYSFGFRNVPFTDAHLKRLVTRKVDKLVLMKTDVTDAGLRHLIGMKRLQDLSLTGPFSDNGLRHIAELTELTKLTIKESKLTNDGMKHLAGLKNLRELDLGMSSGISDAGLSHLYALKSLKVLNLFHCKVSDNGVQELQARIPGCTVRR